MEVVAFPRNWREVAKKPVAGEYVVWAQEDINGFKKGNQYRITRVVMDGGETFFDVLDDNRNMRNRYHYRFGPIVQENKEPEKMVVVCINPAGTALKNGEEYVVEAEHPTTYKLEGFPRLYKKTRFVIKGQENKPVDKTDEILSELKDKVKKEGVKTCSYATLYNDDTINWQVGDVCHARLFYGADKGIKGLFLNVSGHLDKHNYKEAYKEYIKYITTESPWAKAFLPRPLEKVMEDGVAMDVTQPHNYVISAAVALRVGSEYPITAREFYALVKLGVPCNIAWIVACYAAQGDKVSTSALHGGHHVFASGMDVECIKVFFNKGECNKPGTTVNELKQNRYEILKCISNEYAANSFSQWLVDNHKGVEKNDTGWGLTHYIRKHPQYGWMPLVFTIAQIIK
jgi:hypothetical protein